MSDGAVGEADFRNWAAESWDDLRAIWAALIPELADEIPSFRGVSLTPQRKGWVFERWVMEGFRLSGAEIDHRHANPRRKDATTLEEIDGLVFDGWQGFVVESKYEKKKVDIDPIFRLHLMAEQRPIGTIGLFFSASGFTDQALELVDRLRPIRVLLFTRADIDWAAGTGEGMMRRARRKWIEALRSGRMDVKVPDSIATIGGP